MSVENIRPVIIYPVDNVEAVIGVPFEFPFVALGGLTVKFVDRDTGVQTLLQLNVHYTRAGNTITLTDLAVPLFSGTDVVLVISRAVEFTQEISFTEGDDFYAETVNDALDALVYQTQDLNERLRGVLLPPVGVDQITWEAFMEALNNAAKVPGMELTIAQALLDIITAQAAADLGIEKADTAQATADAGVSGANAAHMAAVEAQTTANEAVGLANDAQATADEAMSLIEPATTTTRGTVTLTTEEGVQNGDPNLVVTANFLKHTNDVVAQIIAQSAPDATETVKGITTRATTAKALAGTDNVSFMTAALVRTVVDAIPEPEPVPEATVDTVGGSKLGSLETLIAGDDEGRVVPQSLVRQLLGHELEWKRLPYQNVSLPNTALPSFGNGRMMMSWWNSGTTQMFVADNRGETMLPRTAITSLAHMAANYSPRWGSHVFMSNSTSFRWTYDGDTWTIGTVTSAPTNMGLAATCVTRNGQAMFFAANYFYLHGGVAALSTTAWTPSWSGTTAAAHNDATGTTIALGYGTTTNGAYIMRAVNDTNTFTRTLALPFAATLPSTHKLTCGNGIFVGVVTGTNCVFRSTDDGVTWTAKGLPDGVFAQDIAFGDGKFVIATPYNCNYVYVSPDGEDWTTVPLPTLTYSNVTPRIAFADGDFYILRPNQPVGRTGVTSWFLRRKASTIPEIGDPLVPTTWSSFTIGTSGVVVPEGFNTLNYPNVSSYPILRNRAETLAAAGSPAGSVEVRPGDLIYFTSGSLSGCSFTYQLLPPVSLIWGAGGMASGTYVYLSEYASMGYTKAIYQSVAVGDFTALHAEEYGQDIIHTVGSTDEGSFSLGSVSTVIGMYDTGGSISLTLTEGTAPDWNGTINNRREYVTPTPLTLSTNILGDNNAYTVPSREPVPYTWVDVHGELQAQGNEDQLNAFRNYPNNVFYITTVGWEDYNHHVNDVSLPVETGDRVWVDALGASSNYVGQLRRVYGRRTYVENLITQILFYNNTAYTVPAGITQCNYYISVNGASSGTLYTVGLRRNGVNINSGSAYGSGGVVSGVIAVAAGDVLTFYSSPTGNTGAISLLLAGRGSYVDMTPASGSPATTMPAIGVAPVQPVPVIATVEEGENLGANYPIAKANIIGILKSTEAGETEIHIDKEYPYVIVNTNTTVLQAKNNGNGATLVVNGQTTGNVVRYATFAGLRDNMIVGDVVNVTSCILLEKGDIVSLKQPAGYYGPFTMIFIPPTLISEPFNVKHEWDGGHTGMGEGRAAGYVAPNGYTKCTYKIIGKSATTYEAFAVGLNFHGLGAEYKTLSLPCNKGTHEVSGTIRVLPGRVLHWFGHAKVFESIVAELTFHN